MQLIGKPIHADILVKNAVVRATSSLTLVWMERNVDRAFSQCRKLSIHAMQGNENPFENTWVWTLWRETRGASGRASACDSFSGSPHPQGACD